VDEDKSRNGLTPKKEFKISPVIPLPIYHFGCVGCCVQSISIQVHVEGQGFISCAGIYNANVRLKSIPQTMVSLHFV
jgi:hypothetical protein